VAVVAEPRDDGSVVFRTYCSQTITATTHWPALAKDDLIVVPRQAS
jgi:hypothetical protein